MPDYLVQWELEIEADTPEEAAREAYETMIDLVRTSGYAR